MTMTMLTSIISIDIMAETPIRSYSLKLLSIKYITVYFLKLIFSLKISICFVYSFNMSSPKCILMSFIFGILILPIINGENCAEKSLPGMLMEVEMLFTLIATD